MKNFFVSALIAGLLAAAASAVRAEDVAECDVFSLELTTNTERPTNPGDLKRSRAAIKKVPDAADTVFVGDSLFYLWQRDDIAAEFPESGIWNFSVGGDKTQHALWRMEEAASAHVDAENLVVFLGTNNLGVRGVEPCAIYQGILTVVDKAKELWTPENVFVVTIPPRGRDFHQFDEKRLGLNAMIASGAEMAGYIPVVFSDVDFTCGEYAKGPIPRNPDRCAPPQSYQCVNYRGDFVHFEKPGYTYLAQLLRDSSVTSLGENVFR